MPALITSITFFVVAGIGALNLVALIALTVSELRQRPIPRLTPGFA